MITFDKRIIVEIFNEDIEAQKSGQDTKELKTNKSILVSISIGYLDKGRF